MDDEIVAEARRVVALPKDERFDALPEVLARAGFQERWEKTDVARWEELSPLQQAVARVVAEVPAAAFAGGWGLPHKPRELQRFTGLLPPGPLERPASPGGEPRWRVMRELVAANAPWDEVVARGLDGLSAVERAEASFDLATNAHGILDAAGAQIDPEALKSAMKEAGEGIVPFVRDLCERRAAHGETDPLVREYLPEDFDLMLETLEEMDVAIEPRWREDPDA